VTGLLVNNYSQRNPPTLGEAMSGLLGNWGGNIEQGLLSAFPVLAENDPYKIGQELLREGAGLGTIAGAKAKKIAALRAESRANNGILADDTTEGTLALLHNLSADNLVHADKLGGIPVPSIAITKGSSPMANFGEISLIGDRSMANVSAKNPIYPSDVYSPRYPRATTFFDDDAAREFSDSMQDSAKVMGKNYYHISDDTESVQDLMRDPVFLHKFATDNGVKYTPKHFSDGGINSYGSGMQIKELIASDDTLLNAFNQYAATTWAGLKPYGKIFNGFTPSGRRRYKSENLENVTKMMKGGINAGELMNYGIGSYRAALTPRFKSFKEMKAKESSLTSYEDMLAQNAGLKDEYNELVEQLGRYKGDVYSGDVDVLMTEVALGNDRFSEVFKEVPEDLQRKYMDFNKRLVDAPASYFEGKPQRSVDISEFKGALVPDDTPDEVMALLSRNNISRVEKYKDGADRLEKMKNYKDLMFGIGAMGFGGLLGMPEGYERNGVPMKGLLD
jgi:hypothetical protein